MSIFRLTDKEGNKCYVDSFCLAIIIVDEEENPFTCAVEVEDENEVSNEHILKDYDEFCEYFY